MQETVSSLPLAGNWECVCYVNAVTFLDKRLENFFVGEIIYFWSGK